MQSNLLLTVWVASTILLSVLGNSKSSKHAASKYYEEGQDIQEKLLKNFMPPSKTTSQDNQQTHPGYKQEPLLTINYSSLGRICQ